MELNTDTYCIQKVLEGDTGCFSFFLDKYGQAVYSLVLKIVRSREVAEELTQDVFVKVYRKLPSFRGNCAFSTWLYRIAYNTAVSEARKKKREVSLEDEAVPGDVPEEAIDAVADGGMAVKLEILDEALGRLSPEERAVIVLFYMKEKTVGEIAEITGMTQANVKVRLFRIRKKLYAIMMEAME